MSLSEQEQKVLREIEESLLADDPRFSASVSGSGPGGGGGSSSSVTLRGIALGVVGLVLLVGGVALAQTSLWFIALSVLGFLVMFGAGVWMLRGGSTPARGRQPGAGARKAPRRPADGQGGGGLTGRMEENFRRRFEN